MSNFNNEPPLCKCGCCREVTWNKQKNKWNIFLKGHHTFNKIIPLDKDSPLCACGCGNPVKWDKWKKQWSRFIKGHSARLPEVREKLKKINTGKKHTKETKQKLREINLGKKHSEETKIKCGNTFRGKKHTEEIKALMSEIAKNKDPEIAKRIGEAQRGKKLSEETKNKISEASKGRKIWCDGKKLTKEHIQKRTLSRIKCRTGEGGYCDQWYDFEYRDDLRKTACEQCGITAMMSLKLFGTKLSNHHIDEDKLNCHSNNFKTFCKHCHTKLHWELKHNPEKKVNND